ncbi:MAG TPA: hypothetical protein VHE61_15950 [Opitutaceae bacterium]|nr:hypothetical protein [Opitutaceae bacterium]
MNLITKIHYAPFAVAYKISKARNESSKAGWALSVALFPQSLLCLVIYITIVEMYRPMNANDIIVVMSGFGCLYVIDVVTYIVKSRGRAFVQKIDAEPKAVRNRFYLVSGIGYVVALGSALGILEFCR